MLKANYYVAKLPFCDVFYITLYYHHLRSFSTEIFNLHKYFMKTISYFINIKFLCLS